MYTTFLRFAAKRHRAGALMQPHMAWLQRGFDDGVFLLAGSIEPQAGGAIVAHNTTLAELQTRVQADPFVAEGVVRAEIVQVTPSRADERLAFLLD